MFVMCPLYFNHFPWRSGIGKHFHKRNEAVLQQRRYDRLCTFLELALEPSMVVTQALGCCKQSGYRTAEGSPDAGSRSGSQSQSLVEAQASAWGNKMHRLK